MLWGLAHLIVAGLFHDLEIDRPEEFGNPFRRDGARLVVANHSNGFVDVVVLIVALGYYPRFIAKADLYKHWPLRWLMRAVGAIPIYSSSDSEGNSSSFSAVHEALNKGRTVALFPEGNVSDEERLQPIRTGAARMALGAASETTGIDIVPVGLTYVDKISLRTRGLARIAPSVSLDNYLDERQVEPDEQDRPAVRDLTELIRDQLAEISPDFGSLEREARLVRVADMLLRTDLTDAYADPPVSDSIGLASRIAHLPPAVEEDILDEAGRYHLELAATSLRDDQISPRARIGDLLKSFVISVAKLALVLPLALVGFATNLIPAFLVMVAGSVPREPVSKGTARMLTALVVFPSAWALAIWTSGRTGWALTWWVTLLVLGSVLLVVAASTMIDVVEAGISWRRVHNRRALVDRVLRLRQVTVDYISERI